MTPLQTITLLNEYTGFLESSPDQGEDIFRLLKVLKVTSAEVVRRRVECRPGSLELVFGELKPAVRIACDLMDELKEEQYDELRNWQFGKLKQNQAESAYSLLHNIVQELTIGILEIQKTIRHSRLGRPRR